MNPQPSRKNTNRANAQHSTGPKTDAGKQRSSLNALRHGLTAQRIVMPEEDLQAYHDHVRSFTTEYHPQGALLLVAALLGEVALVVAIFEPHVGP